MEKEPEVPIHPRELGVVGALKKLRSDYEKAKEALLMDTSLSPEELSKGMGRLILVEMLGLKPDASDADIADFYAKHPELKYKEKSNEPADEK